MQMPNTLTIRTRSSVCIECDWTYTSVADAVSELTTIDNLQYVRCLVEWWTNTSNS